MTRKLTTEEYMSYMDKTPVACIDIVLFNEDRTQVLLFKRTNEPAQGIYYTPGGCIQKGETFAEAAVRKMEQELGITLDAGKLNNPQVIEELWPNSAFPNISYHAITVFFGYTLTEREAATITLDPQHNARQWFAVDDASIHPYLKQRIRALQ
ncbi:hypothetical protein A3C89_01655 [Candidatus Kaiserbacteria bacterium RIFCSPHIGHO2_02_FULL_50_50]|uniref:Nudix hydrolase domain-containing protein n=1 Tax=Candidatus Kaiserbacteria bacterium RIFCSPHIGHO2_02_FULL_50_50 TaxID=1798492 RepID=A0A1F6DCH4_9BACT|nr:MAG: hypothetical protein A3C89_01655 [Candidatus Kaiserbacteria bacterium RIFCSPHIGHO2_02_FULL_50_50]OGG88159.1 MAG: hypothetical protein A3G62_02690 [Candidatus Kaiserbacteria bacterium RIFCSPLOWO2_12_FULL_50_10]